MKLRTARRPRMPRRSPQRPIAAKTLRARAATIETQDDEYYDEQEPSMKLSHAFIVVLVLHVIAVGGIWGFNMLKARQIAGSHTSQSANATQPGTADNADTVKAQDGQGAGPQASPPAQVNQVAAAPVGTPGASPAHPVKPKTHTIVAGETLTKIAVKYGTTVHALERANNMTSATSIRVGQVLKIPTPGAPIPAAAPVAEASHTPADTIGQPAPAAKTADVIPGAGGTYTVAKGDNPYKIARKLHVTQAELLKANNITDPKKLQIGQKLIVPVKKSANASQ